MTSSRDRRILKELSDIENDKSKSGVYAKLKDDSNLTRLEGWFPAPPETPYTGGTYYVDITIPDGYPFKSPVIRFDTRIWHPNVSSQTVSLPCRSPSLPRPHYHRAFPALSHQLLSSPSLHP